MYSTAVCVLVLLGTWRMCGSSCQNVDSKQADARGKEVYRIAGNFRGIKLSRKCENRRFCGENFRGSTIGWDACAHVHLRTLNSRRKLSRTVPNPRNSRKFYPSKVSRYTVYIQCTYMYTCTVYMVYSFNSSNQFMFCSASLNFRTIRVLYSTGNCPITYMYIYIYMYMRSVVGSNPTRQFVFLRKSDCLGCVLLLCLVVCLTLLASF